MKRFTSLLFTFLLLFVFSGFLYSCGKDNGDDNGGNEQKEKVEKRSGNYKSSVLLADTLDEGRYQVIIESKNQVRFLLCKEYETAFNCYYAIALFGENRNVLWFNGKNP